MFKSIFFFVENIGVATETWSESQRIWTCRNRFWYH